MRYTHLSQPLQFVIELNTEQPGSIDFEKNPDMPIQCMDHVDLNGFQYNDGTDFVDGDNQSVFSENSDLGLDYDF